jgi:hypothetical protein
MEQEGKFICSALPLVSQHLSLLLSADDCNYESLLLLYWMHALFVENYSRTLESTTCYT